MCVIIFSEKGTHIGKKELFRAWMANPDGAGFAVQTGGEVLYRKGFMDFHSFYKAFEKWDDSKYTVAVHFRITSRGRTTKEQTHPFKAGAPNTLYKATAQPVFFMNGTIWDIVEKEDLNDTASFIEKFKHALTPSVDCANLLEYATGAKWLIFAPDSVFFSSGFVEYGGLWYSNLYHKKSFFDEEGEEIYIY